MFFVYLLISFIPLFIVLYILKIPFLIYINKQYNSDGILGKFYDSIYYGISAFHTPPLPKYRYEVGFENIKAALTIKSLGNIICIAIITTMLYYDLPVLLTSIPLTFHFMRIFAEKRYLDAIKKDIERDKEADVDEDIDDTDFHNVFIKTYYTLFYYQVIMSLTTLPLSVLLLYVGCIFKFI